jgi:hypothetical protein
MEKQEMTSDLTRKQWEGQKKIKRGTKNIKFKGGTKEIKRGTKKNTTGDKKILSHSPIYHKQKGQFQFQLN